MRPILSALVKAIPFSARSKIKSIPVLGVAQRKLVEAALDDAEFVHRIDAGPAKDIRFLIRLPDDKGIWTGTYEPEFAQRLAVCVRPGSVCYDIGSWHGFFAGVMAANGAAEVHVFEPLPENAARITALITLNPSKRFTLHQKAVGETDSQLDLIVMPKTSMAKLETSSFQPTVSAQQRIKVEVCCIDSLVDAGSIAPPSLIKIDVEGAEAQVLKGACQTIDRYRPEIFAEIHSAALREEVSDILEERGYGIESLDADRDAARAKDVFLIHAAPC